MISVIICCYNGERTLRQCLDSILAQEYKEIEILCIDGGSTDKTKDIIAEYWPVRLIHNKNKLPEGSGCGKWLGCKQAKGEIIALIDQDNVLQRTDLFSQVVQKFKKDKELLGIAGGMVHDKSDAPVVRYVSLVGTDSFLAYRSLDFVRHTDIDLLDDDGDFTREKDVFKLEHNNMLLTGGNCFFYLKKDLDSIGGYTQDILVLDKLIDKKNKIEVIPGATKHYAETSLLALAKKKFMWGDKYFFNKQTEGYNYFPSTPKEYLEFSLNLAGCLFIIPNFYDASSLLIKSGDWVSLLYPPMAFLNTLAYGFAWLKGKVKI